MTQDRRINIGGNVNRSVFNSGDGNIISQINSDSSDEVVEEIRDIFERLYKSYSHANEMQKLTVLEMELQQKVKEDPTFKQRFISAAKSGGLELVKVVTDNPFISVPLETVKGWIEA
jgi:acyl-CoA synthetase (NDP forming)